MRRILEAIILMLAGAILFLAGMIFPVFPLQSTEDTMGKEEALKFIDQAILSHQYYVVYPERQSFATGNTEFNVYEVEQYLKLRKLLISVR